MTTKRNTKKPKAKRETARELRAQLERLQAEHQHLLSKSMTRENTLRELTELLRPFIEEIANECATDHVYDHELAEHTP